MKAKQKIAENARAECEISKIDAEKAKDEAKKVKEEAEKAKHEAAKVIETSKQITEQSLQETYTAKKITEKAKASEKEKAETIKDCEQVKFNNLKVIELFNKGKIIIQPPLQENQSKCTKCDKIYVDDKQLETHLSLNGCILYTNKYKCELCDRTSTEEEHLSVHHIKEHVDCDKCNKIIKNESELQKHRNICSTKRTYKNNKYKKIHS